MIFAWCACAAQRGGLEAYLGILRNLPADTGMAFVIASHRGLGHAYLLPQALVRTTAMPIVEVEQGMRLVPNRVFLMPPGKDMTIEGDVFDLVTKSKRRGWPVTISIFLRSIAAAYESRAVAVILSGMDVDGSAALQAIKAAGGATFAQSNPAFVSMPRYAVETGYVDFVLPPVDIANALSALAQKVPRRRNRRELAPLSPRGIESGPGLHRTR